MLCMGKLNMTHVDFVREVTVRLTFLGRLNSNVKRNTHFQIKLRFVSLGNDLKLL